MTVQNLRPGVYSRYDVTSMYTTPLSLKYAAVVARSIGGESGELYRFTSYQDACEIFSPDGSGVIMRSLIGLLFDSGVSVVLAVPAGDGYESALTALETAENVGAIICDATNIDDLTALKVRVAANSDARRECLGFCGIDDPTRAMEAARTLNCERIVFACPAVSSKTEGTRAAALAAAALAGKILASGDAAANLNGCAFPLPTLPEPLPESTIQSLLEAGVTVFESVGGETECIRATTTRTMTSGAPDRSMTGVNTILIIDDVMQSVRSMLKSHLSGSRVNGSPLESIRSQVTIVLAEKQNDGLLESFSAPRCYASSSDPSVCVVEMSFAVAHAVSQIHVTAHIQV